jgi:hypothetical protein
MMRRVALILGLLVGVASSSVATDAAADDSYKTAGGLAVYLGVLPAAMIQGHPRGHPEEAMHGGVPSGRHAYHVVAAVFDAATGERVEDAVVEARVGEPGLAGVTRQLEPMVIADTVTYGNYFQLSGDAPYRIDLSITRPGLATPIRVEFTYEHRTR